MLLKSKKFKFGLVLLGILSMSFGVGCTKGTSNSNNENKKEITVSAAASLTESLKEIKENYEKDNKDIDIKLNLGASSKLRTQIEQGAKSDIFISANKKQYDILNEKGLISEGKQILSNSIVLVVPKENPANINSLEDLKKKNKLVIAEKEVPVGNYTLKVLEKLNSKYGKNFKESVLKNVVSKELDVKKVLSKVVLGEGDAAFVYYSDVTPKVKDKVKVIEIPKEYNIKAQYWMGILKSSKDKKEVKDLYDVLLNEKSKTVFKKYFFETVN